MWLCGMILLPVALMLFFAGLLAPGLPLKVPTAIVDLDHSSMSRQITRDLNATELIDITECTESYDKALSDVRSGRIMGFFVIPANFERDAVSGRTPTLEFYNNLTFFVPGTLAFKGFKTVAVTTSAGMVMTTLSAAGLPADQTEALIQPVSVDTHPIGNPWLSYGIYLCPSFIWGVLALMIMMMCAYAITMEIKNGTSPQWLATAGGSMPVALAGKLLPHFVIWSVVGQFALALLFGWCGYPCGNIWWMMVAMELFIIASQAMGVLFVSIVPNPRLSMILCALTGILSFSYAGFSFPVQEMYGAIGIFSYLMPVRYMFLIYIFVALDAFPVYYSRFYFVALIMFPLVASLLMWRLKKACSLN